MTLVRAERRGSSNELDLESDSESVSGVDREVEMVL